MADLSHLYGNDFRVSATGDLLLSSGTEYGQQRVLRRLLTSPLDDPWNSDYGAGLPGEVGQPASPLRIKAIITAQLAREAAVAADPPPEVSAVASLDGTVIASLTYADAGTGGTASLTVPLRG